MDILEPFDPRKHKPQDVGLGGLSTEYLITAQAPDGGFWNIPSIWWDKSGSPILVDEWQAVKFAEDYEKRTGRNFPRFDDPGAGAFFAMNRSEMGGASNNVLAKYGGE